MKLQLLLVDDEPKILQGLINNDWASVGIGQVFRAASGLEAVEVLKQQTVDIVVTDIRMPGMDGLQLCKHVHDHYPHTKCILLSGYGEFEYARRAMEHGTVGYLLKPVKDEDLLAEVDRVGGLVREEWDRTHTLARARQTLHTHLPQLREGLLGDLLAGREYAAEALRKRLTEYRLPFASGDACALVLIRVDQAFAPFGERDIALFEYAVLNVLMIHPGQILSRSQIEEKLYGWQEEVESNAVEVHIHHLRAKLGPGMIQTVRGIGYRLGEEP